MVWAIVIAVAVVLHIAAYLIYKVGKEVLEVEGSFLAVSGGFLILFLAAAVGLKFMIPTPGAADVASIPKAWMTPAFAAE